MRAVPDPPVTISHKQYDQQYISQTDSVWLSGILTLSIAAYPQQRIINNTTMRTPKIVNLVAPAWV